MTFPSSKNSKSSVVAIGVFDGVHLGHQKILSKAVTLAQKNQIKSVAITFDPHPIQVLSPKKFSGYICSLSHRLRLIKEQGIDQCQVIPFSKSFSRWSSEKFVQEVLMKNLNASSVVVGEDFCFGYDRRSDVRDLIFWGEQYEYQVNVLPIAEKNQIPVKSRAIRRWIQQGAFQKASSLLGREFFISSTVIHGDQIGRSLGFPTANLQVDGLVLPTAGVYLAKVGYQKKLYQSVLYIGHRPSISRRGDATVSVEAHLLNFSGDLYHQSIDVYPIEKIADEQKFSKKEDLIHHIQHCIDLASQK